MTETYNTNITTVLAKFTTFGEDLGESSDTVLIEVLHL
jgi:hypothetical protein